MVRLKKVYLAGPEVFLPDAIDIATRKKRLCLEYGFEGLFPFDSELEKGLEPLATANGIYRANIALMQASDFIIANLTPFRGPSADIGVAFELGITIGMGRPAFGYTNDPRNLLDRLRQLHQVTEKVGKRPRWCDRARMTVEDFGLSDNLMIACALHESGLPIVRRQIPRERLYTDLEGFAECLYFAREHWTYASG